MSQQLQKSTMPNMPIVNFSPRFSRGIAHPFIISYARHVQGMNIHIELGSCNLLLWDQNRHDDS